MLTADTPRSRLLLLQYLQNNQGIDPSYTVGAGIANAGSKILNAYMVKTLLDKEAKSEQSDASNKSRAMSILMGQGISSPNHPGMSLDASTLGDFNNSNAGKLLPSPSADNLPPGMPQQQTANLSWDKTPNMGAAGSREALIYALGADPKNGAGYLPTVAKALQGDQEYNDAKPMKDPATGQMRMGQSSKTGGPVRWLNALPPDEKTDHTSTYKEAVDLGLQPGTPQFQKYLKDAADLERAQKTSQLARNQAETTAAIQKNNLLNDIPEGVTGPAVLDMLKPTERASVQSIISGDQPLPSRTANPQGQRIAGLVVLADPTYTSARLKVKQDVATGQTSANIKRLGTAIGHIDSLITSMGKLNNTSIPMLNAPLNYAKKNISGDAAINDVKVNANAVASELEAAFRGTGSSITGIHEWRDSISPNMSPEQQAGVKEKALELLDSRLDSVANQWNQVMPPNLQRGPMDFLSPKQREVYARLHGQPNQQNEIDDLVSKYAGK